MLTLNRARALLFLPVLALSLCLSCASEPMLEPVVVSSQSGPPPADLMEVARYVRAAGGVVVQAMTPAMTVVEQPVRLPALTGLLVEYQIVSTDLQIMDSLGSAASSPARVWGSNGHVGLVDEMGQPSNRPVVVSGGGISAWKTLEGGSDGVFFLLPTTTDRATIPWQLYWYARTSGRGVVSGTGTASGAEIAIDRLRLPGA